jgi:hypothetical protein
MQKLYSMDWYYAYSFVTFLFTNASCLMVCCVICLNFKHFTMKTLNSERFDELPNKQLYVHHHLTIVTVTSLYLYPFIYLPIDHISFYKSLIFNNYSTSLLQVHGSLSQTSSLDIYFPSVSWWFVFLLLSFEISLHILDAGPIRYMICNVFS